MRYYYLFVDFLPCILRMRREWCAACLIQLHLSSSSVLSLQPLILWVSQQLDNISLAMKHRFSLLDIHYTMEIHRNSLTLTQPLDRWEYRKWLLVSEQSVAHTQCVWMNGKSRCHFGVWCMASLAQLHSLLLYYYCILLNVNIVREKGGDERRSISLMRRPRGKRKQFTDKMLIKRHSMHSLQEMNYYNE